jgi:hypothetical protein
VKIKKDRKESNIKKSKRKQKRNREKGQTGNIRIRKKM